MTYTGIASTAGLDADKDRILSWDLEGTEKRKVPLIWNHNAYDNVPIGMAEVWKGKDDVSGLDILETSFELYDSTDNAKAVKQSIDDGALTALSVGFASKVHSKNAEGGFDFQNASLRELSVVINPANPDARIIIDSTEVNKTEGGDMIFKGHVMCDVKSSDPSDKPIDDNETDESTNENVDTENTNNEPTNDESETSDTKDVNDKSTSDKSETSEDIGDIEDLRKAVKDLTELITKSTPLAKSDSRDTMEVTTHNVATISKRKAVNNTTQKETNNMVNKSERELRNLFTKSVLDTLDSNKDMSFGEIIQKSIDFGDADVNYDSIANILNKGIPSGSEYLDKLPAIAPFNHNVNFIADLTPDEAQAIAHTTGQKKEQVVKMTKRQIVEGEILVLQEIDYKALKEDTKGKVIAWALDVLAKQLNVAIQKQILVGNPLLKDVNRGTYDLYIDDKIVPIATDNSVYTTQVSLDKLTVEGVVDGLAEIKSDGPVIAVMSRKTLNALRYEKGNDGHYMLPMPTKQALEAQLDSQIQVSDMIPDGQIVAHDIESYQRFSANGGSEYIDGYEVRTNSKLIENVTLMGGALSKPQSAVNITVKASDKQNDKPAGQ